MSEEHRKPLDQRHFDDSLSVGLRGMGQYLASRRKADTPNERPSIRFREGEREIVEQAVRLEGTTFSDYARTVLLRAAKKRIKRAGEDHNAGRWGVPAGSSELPYHFVVPNGRGGGRTACGMTVGLTGWTWEAPPAKASACYFCFQKAVE